MQEEVNRPKIQCYQCRRPQIACICDYVQPLDTQTRFIILMHPKEYKKEKNGTGHMTMMQLHNSEIIVDVDFTHNKRVNELLNQKHTRSFLLYPGKDSFNLSTQSGPAMQNFMGTAAQIFILDGTWPCARKMLKLSTNLQALDRVSFDNDIQSQFLIKQQPKSLCLSTIESVHTVLNALHKGGVENCNTQSFLAPFEQMIAFQLKFLLNSEKTNKRLVKDGQLIPQTNYKNNPERNVFFDPNK